MEAYQKANRDLNITAYLFLLFALGKAISTIQTNITYASQHFWIIVNPLLLIMDVINLFYIIASLFIFKLIHKRKNNWRMIAVIVITINISFSASSTPRILFQYFNNTTELSFLFWFSTLFQWCFYIWVIYILSRKDILHAFRAHYKCEEVSYAKTNGDD